MGQTQSSDAWDVAWGPVTPQGRRRCCLIAGCAQDRDFGAARRLLSLGWRVIVACRDPTAAAATVRDLRAGVAESAQQGPPTPAWAAGGAGSAPDGAGAALTTSASSKAEPGREPGPEPGHVSAMQLDVTSLASVRAFAREYEAAGHRLDVLLCAAGAPPSEVKRVSVDGLDLQMAANYLGYFHLVQRLLPCLQASAPARVVFASSPAARRGQIKYTDLQFRTGEYDAARMYQQSTVALVRQRSLCNLPCLYCVLVRLAHALSTDAVLERRVCARAWCLRSPLDAACNVDHVAVGRARWCRLCSPASLRAACEGLGSLQTASRRLVTRFRSILTPAATMGRSPARQRSLEPSRR